MGRTTKRIRGFREKKTEMTKKGEGEGEGEEQ